jgi:hypothetical protein
VSFLANVDGASAASMAAFAADPVAWALDLLGLPAGSKPSNREVRARFRTRLMDVHPDLGGDERVASKRIGELAEARRILLG